jgi:hypothetical protein
MRSLILSLLTVLSFNASANSIDFPAESGPTSVQVSQMFDTTNTLPVVLVDLVLKEEKVNLCISDYVAKRDKSYDKITQNTLYDMIHNFGKIAARVYGKKPQADDVPFEQKIEALARVQCQAYYALGALN